MDFFSWVGGPVHSEIAGASANVCAAPNAARGMCGRAVQPVIDRAALRLGIIHISNEFFSRAHSLARPYGVRRQAKRDATWSSNLSGAGQESAPSQSPKRRRRWALPAHSMGWREN